MSKRILSILLVAGLVVSCGDDNGTKPPVDSISPGTILDLTITDSVGTSFAMTWTATGDDGDVGTAHQYDVRYADVPLSASNWDDATVVTGVGAPAEAGESESLSIENLTWWTRTYVGVRAIDEAGNASDISNIAVGTPYPDPAMRMLIQSRDGVIEMDMEGNGEVLIEGNREVEVLDGHIFAGGNYIEEFDRTGTLLRTIIVPAPPGAWYFGALPGDRFLLMSNNTDTVHVVDATGAVLAKGALLPAPGANLQSMECIVVGNSVIISEDGENHVMQMDLTTYAVSQFKDLTMLSGWLGAIAHHDGVYYLCRGGRSLYSFTSATDPVLIADLAEEDYNITGAVYAGGHMFAVLNFAGKLIRINVRTGEIVMVADGLNYPQDVALLPAP